MSESASTARPPRQRARLELRIVLDTNQLFTTGSASELLRAELRRLIVDSRRHSDVLVSWYLPEVVVLERRFQMVEAARDLLPATVKLERLLGHGLAITESILRDHVRSAIESQIADVGLKVVTLDPSRVDWQRLIRDSADRKAPFSAGKHEKGFRDAIVAETFLQIAGDSPRSQRTCRVALVTGDEGLVAAVAERADAFGNIKVIKSLEELQDLMNVVVADVTEKFIDGIREAATRCFFVENDESTLFLAAGVAKTLSATYSAELATKPDGATTRKNGTWYIGPTGFSSKKGQRVHWVTTIQVEATAYRQESLPALSRTSGVSSEGSVPETLRSLYSTLAHPQPAHLAGLWDAKKAAEKFTFADLLKGLPETRDIEVASGGTSFEVSWSVTVTAAGKLINPKLESTRFAETTWAGKPSA